METVVLEVPDISCEHCARAIGEALGPLAGVGEVSVDVGGRTVTVAYDAAAVGAGRIAEALAEADYPVAGRR